MRSDATKRRKPRWLPCATPVPKHAFPRRSCSGGDCLSQGLITKQRKVVGSRREDWESIQIIQLISHREYLQTPIVGDDLRNSTRTVADRRFDSGMLIELNPGQRTNPSGSNGPTGARSKSGEKRVAR